MIKTLNAGLAALGLVATGTVAALVTTGAVEGLSAVPGWLATATGVGVFLGSLALAGNVAVELDPRHPYLATAIPALIVLAVGYAAATASERSVGEGLELDTIFILAAGLLAMMTTSTFLTRRRGRRETPEVTPAD